MNIRVVMGKGCCAKNKGTLLFRALKGSTNQDPKEFFVQDDSMRSRKMTYFSRLLFFLVVIVHHLLELCRGRLLVSCMFSKDLLMK